MKTSTPEEEYFAREEAEKLRKLATEEKKRRTAAEREDLKKLHWMRCPKCGLELKEMRFKDIIIDKCFACNGTFLDAGELEKIAGKEREGMLKSIVRIFEKG
jgi:hypothetical protein